MTVAAASRPGYPSLGLLIDGAWRDRPGSRVVRDPSTGATIASLPEAGDEDLDAAVAAAVRGFAAWRDTPPAERCRIMVEAARLMRARTEEFASVMTQEQGKPIAQSRSEVERASAIIEWDAHEGPRLYGRVIPSAPGMRHTVLRLPLGPVAAFSPWNFPVGSPARKVGGALAAGCSIVLKPAEETPGSAVLLARAFQDAGLPPGVLNLVTGDPEAISRRLVPHPDIRMVTFTGSVTVGKRLAALAGEHMKPAIMELGGHAPVVVCADADPVKAAALCVATKARNAGQVCVSPTRFLVDAAIAEAFTEEFVGRAAALRLGDGFDTGAGLGPLANPRRVSAIEALVEDARSRGARVAAGGRRPERDGFFYPLTVLTDVPDDARCLRDEPFGPLAIIVVTRGLDDAIARANALPYALAAYAFTDSARTIERLGREIVCGNLAINHLTASFPETPFGGVRDSGYGREGGQESLDGYTYAKLVSVAAG